jgi:hypothetical protein
MKYNKQSQFEKPPQLCPRTCGTCDYFANGVCTANVGRDHTFAFSNPKDRPLPMPLMCPWWYINNVWDRVDDEAIKEYRETRLHQFVTWVMLYELADDVERGAFVEHLHRPAGGCLIDFEKYPGAKDIYDRIRALDGQK